jgi:OmpA-OmpF porin, OOP family
MLSQPTTPASFRGNTARAGWLRGSRERRRSAAAAAALLCCSLWAAEVRAEGCQAPRGLTTCVDVDNLWMHPGAGPFFSLGPTLTTAAGRISFGLALSYLSRPIGFNVSSPDPAGAASFSVDNALDASLLWGIGLTDRFELTLAAPVTLFQDGKGLNAVLGTQDELPRSAIRDFRFGMALRILSRPRSGEDRGPALTARLEFGAPVGTKNAFASTGTMVTVPTVVFDLRKGRFDLSAELGARIRPDRALADAVIGTQLSAALGASFDVIPRGALTLGAEAFGLFTLASQGQSTPSGDAARPPLLPMEWIASATTAPFLGGDVSMSLGGGGPIPTSSEGAVTSPRFRVNLALRYAPSGRDADADGVLDRDDKCLDVPEDRDGYKDDDGCPDPDNDGDRIPDARDRCRDEAEDFDGYRDDDGCPDLDDDTDGVPDGEDRCRNEPEDRDSFEDDDGCPEPDNDKDGILDAKDKCPNGAEDFDRYKDDDGCPDPDDDLDQIPDATDKCPSEPEDRDGFQDDDGCPEPDNDQDGILDKEDRCPLVAETINGDKDDDGCPEPDAKSLVSWSGDRVVAAALGRFAPGSDKLTPELEKQVKMMAQLIRSHAPVESVIIEAFADRPGDASAQALDLAGRRASAVKEALVGALLPADRITAAAGDLAAKRAATDPAIEVTVRRAAVEKKRR